MGSDVFQEKNEVKPSTQPKSASKRLREQWREVSLHQGTGRSRTSSLYGSHLDHGGGCVPWSRSLLEGKKGFYLTIYRRSFRNIKYLSAKWGKSKEGLKSCRKNTWELQLPGK